MKKIILSSLLVLSYSYAQMTFDEFMTSFKKEFSGNVQKAKEHISEVYDKNKEKDSKHAVVDTTQDVVVDSAKAYWGLTKEAYRDAQIMYHEYQLKELKKQKEKLSKGK